MLKLVSGSKQKPHCHIWLQNSYAHIKTNILVSVLNIIFFSCDVNLNTQDFVYSEFVTVTLLSINCASVEIYQLSRNAMYEYAYLLYSYFIYRHVQTVFLYQNEL